MLLESLTIPLNKSNCVHVATWNGSKSIHVSKIDTGPKCNIHISLQQLGQRNLFYTGGSRPVKKWEGVKEFDVQQ